MKVVAFNGSPRADGNTAALLRAVLDVLEAEDIATEFVQVGGQSLHGCRACMRCAELKTGRCAFNDDIANACIEKMIEADGVIIGSPTYFADLTSETKALIDRAGYAIRNGGNLMRRKVGAAVVVERRAGSIHAFDSINHFFLIQEMIVPGSSYWTMAVARNRGDAAQDAEGMRIMRDLGANMAWLLKKLSQ